VRAESTWRVAARRGRQFCHAGRSTDHALAGCPRQSAGRCDPTGGAVVDASKLEMLACGSGQGGNGRWSVGRGVRADRPTRCAPPATPSLRRYSRAL